MITYTVKVHENGTKSWWLNGQRHREDGPAIEYANGDKFWYLNGQRHREDGPAREWANGTKFWYLNGECHREDGPAVEWDSGSKEWYLNDQKLTEEEFNNRTQTKELTIEQIEQRLGYKIKVVGE